MFYQIFQFQKPQERQRCHYLYQKHANKCFINHTKDGSDTAYYVQGNFKGDHSKVTVSN